MSYSKARICSDRDLFELQKLWSAQDPIRVKRFYNLFYLEKREIRNIHNEDWWKAFKAKLEKSIGLETYSHYFLEYVEGSFTRAHSDNADDIGGTIVTLVDTSDNLDGGEALGYLPHFKKDIGEFDLNRYRDNDHEDTGNHIIPVVIKQQVGESIMYGPEFQHAVSQVITGRRRVLISWFKK